ncbi:uncharacterized protein KY384_003629 [Bacidia gigantensis]|uniref:uncharacterized protein n=1 Tax=Bacidia gigantensis TaxID=2732470 RepID=UPI001D054EC3|nr:uncharacterized protein KY384_003629 [Bacidia gigantensis]KAG8531993.1 hypothetical protein KY384_003629 [Bacidia gigantensis]
MSSAEVDDGGSLAHITSISRPHSPSKDSPPVVCVFCGSSPGTNPQHIAAAKSLGEALHAHGINLVYGGGTTGLMGEVARTVVALSGPGAVHGVIPDALIQFEQQGRPEHKDVLTKESGTSALDEKIYGRTTVVPDMHTRKQLMAKKVIEGGPGSGFVALSGGFGTMEELMEVTTWNLLRIHDKPVVMLNVDGYYDGLITWVKRAVTDGFVAPGNAGILVEALSVDECLQALREYKVCEGRLKLDWTQK